MYLQKNFLVRPKSRKYLMTFFSRGLSINIYEVKSCKLYNNVCVNYSVF